MVNLMVAEAGDEVIADRVRTHRAKIFAALSGALERTRENEKAVADKANLLVAAVIGLHTTTRTATTTGELPDQLAGICQQVQEWRESASRSKSGGRRPPRAWPEPPGPAASGYHGPGRDGPGGLYRVSNFGSRESSPDGPMVE